VTRATSIRLGLSLLAALLSAACAGSTSRTTDLRQNYLATRARYGRTIDSLYAVSPSTSTAADRAAVADLATRLRKLVAPLMMAGVTDTGVVDLGTFLSGNINVDLPDGISYRGAPVTSSAKRVYFAQLINRAQDDCYDCVPHWVLVGVGVDTRIMFAEVPVTDTMPVPADCAKVVGEYLVQLRACYATALRADARYPRLVAQAQALIEALPRER
jgi:hypothetical protein